MKKMLAIIILALAAAAMVTMYASIMYPLREAVIIGAAIVGGFMAVVWAMRVLLFDDEDGDTDDKCDVGVGDVIKEAYHAEVYNDTDTDSTVIKLWINNGVLCDIGAEDVIAALKNK